MKLSLVVPCYNEQDNVALFFDVVTKCFQDIKYEYEIIFVNDGSKDNTYKKLKEIFSKNSKYVKVINFSRNFGKEAAIYAGLKNATGDFVSIIDADLQQRPEVVLEMLANLEEDEDLDCVAAYQETRSENKTLGFLKSMFYKLINHMSEVNFVTGASDFRTFRRHVVDAILEMPEYSRFSKGIFSWVGFNTKYIPYVAEERANGDSKWSFWKLFKYAVEGIIAFTTVPLKIATFLGMVVSSLSIVYLIFVVGQKVFFSINIPGYATIITLILLLGGLQLLILGIIGEYLARTYIEAKKRPIYIAKEILSDEVE